MSRVVLCQGPTRFAASLLALSFGLLTISGCAKVPEGANFEVTRGPMPLGIFLTNQKLMLPWIALSSLKQSEWCFANVGFSGSSAQVLLEIDSAKPFDPRNAGGAVALNISNSKGEVVYQSRGELRDSDTPDPLSNRWVSEYFHYSSGPSDDLRSTYFGNPEIRASIHKFGKYCVLLKVTETSSLADAKARLVLHSGWK
jgi:hypothetical protein